jgi:DNA-binding response OmpR family regulator
MKVLIVEDDRVMADVIAFVLRREGYEVFQATDGEMALRRQSEDCPDLVILDINLPKMDGFSVCKMIREKCNTPIILLTVRSEEEDILHGFECGADDYIPKPFSPKQFIARVNAVFRRAGMHSKETMIAIGRLQFNLMRREVILDQGRPISLTPLESRLLETLMDHAGQVYTTECLIEILYGERGGDREMLRQVVHRLRSKIQDTPGEYCTIETVPGVGYCLTCPVE